ARCAAGFLIAAGIAAVFAGSIAFLNRFVSDPFLGSTDEVAVRRIHASAAHDEFDVPFPVTEMSLSPAGRYAWFKSEDQNEDITIHAGPIHGPYASFAVDQAILVDDGRLLLLDWRRGTCTLRLVDLEQPGRELWSRRVPITAAHASLDRVTQRWRLLGWNAVRDIVSVTGTIASDEVHEETWKAVATDTASHG